VLGPLLVAALVSSWAITGRGQDATPPADGSTLSNLDDFTVVKTVTVEFGDGKFDVSRSQRAQLQQLITQAQGLRDYVISVVPSAPDVGSDQRLSMLRASAVTAIFRQAGVSLAHVIVSPAMDAGHQVAPGNRSHGRAESRRAVVTLLQSNTSDQ